MKNIALELPPGLFTDQQTQILNDRLREIQHNLGIAEQLRDDLDAAGKRIKNLGDSKDGADAINQRTGDERYPRGGTSGGGGGNSTTNTATTVTGDSTLMFAVAGALAIQADAAPLASLSTPRSVKEIVALLQVASDDGPVECDLMVGAKRWATVTVPAGALTARVAGAGLGPIAANQAIHLHVVKVGPAPNRPGSGLTLQIRFV